MSEKEGAKEDWKKDPPGQKTRSDFDIPTASELGNLNTSSEKVEKDEEDVPADFFDDFLNQEFIAGLNVVDAWEAEEDGEVHSNNSHGKNKSPENKIETQFDKSVSNEAKQTDKKSEDVKKRRDPSKTKRDIQRDKDKCAKDREVKLINEKLKVVETGLVPPGMEMEVDLNDIQQQTKERCSKETNAEAKARKVKDSVESDKGNSMLKTGRKSSGIREDFIPFKVRARSRSPKFVRVRRVRSRSRSFEPPLRDRDGRNFDVLTRDCSDYSSRKVPRYFSNTSPELRKQRGREGSADSGNSDRERWLRNRHRRYSRERSPLVHRSRSRRSPSPEFTKRRKRSVSKSPPRKKGKSFLEELDAKLTKSQYYKEIHQKLNTTSVHPNLILQSNSQMIPPPENFVMEPHMVPNPHMSFQPQPVPLPMQSYYNEQFFIGQPMPMIYNNPTPNAFDSFPNMNQVCPVPPPIDVNLSTPKETVEQLFAEKKISLSDYLHVTAKSSDTTNPVNLQNKIKVISRCQDAVKELSGEVKKEFVFVQSNRVVDRTEVKYQSPLRKQPLVRFQFTTPQKSAEESVFTKNLNKLIDTLRVNNDVVNLERSPTVEQVPLRVESVPQTQTQNNARHTVSRMVSISAQTDTFSCEDCERRSARKFVSQGTQTVTTMTFNVATQVILEELEKEACPSPSDLLKQKSLAYLTPAQLLGQTKSKADSTPSYSKSPGLDISADKRYQRADLFFSRDDRYSNLNIKRSLLGTPQAPNVMDPPRMLNPQMSNPQMPNMSLRANPYSGSIIQQNFMGNFKPNAQLQPQTRPQFNHHPSGNANFGYPADRRF